MTIFLNSLVSKAKDWIIGSFVSIGLDVFIAMMAEEVEAAAGPKGKHDPARSVFRHEPCTVILGGRKIAIRRPRVRTKSGLEVGLEILNLINRKTS